MMFKLSANYIVVSLVSIVMFMEFLDVTIINTAVPSIAKSFLEDPLRIKFSVTSYFLSLAIFTPISGWFADKIGTKTVFLFSVGLFVLASFLCGISNNILQLTLFRFLQGMGGSFMNPVSRILILRSFKPHDLVRVQGYIFTPAMLGFILGPLLGGLLITFLSWRWIFYINIPVGLIVIFVALFYVPQQKEALVPKFDFFGFILSAVSLGSLSFAVDMYGHFDLVSKSLVITIGLIGLVLLILLSLYCLNKKNPILNFLLFKIKTFRIGFSANLTMYMLFASVAFIMPLMYQEHFHYTPYYSGLLILPIACGQLIFRFFAPRIIRKLGFKLAMLISGFSLLFSVFLLAHINLTSTIYFIIVSEFIFGMSYIIFCSATGALNYIDMPRALTAQATSLDLTSRHFASSLGVGFSTLLIHLFRQEFALELSSPLSGKIFYYTLTILCVLVLSALAQAFKLKAEQQ